jgi:NAD(P)-dependent dehydrogenase (short-subunit alcohol dehydrogenase family)
MRGKVCLITGANSGIGKATALGLANMGATVVMVCRNRNRGDKAFNAIRKESGNDAVHLLIADLSTKSAIHNLVAEFKDRFSRLDVLVNNAAILTRKRRLTSDRIETQFFVNHLAPFLLTHLLIDVLKANAPSRIVNVASTAHSSGTLNFDDLQGEKRYKGWQTYANTKLANVLFTYELARRLEGTNVTATCVHPGVTHTNLLSNYSFFLNVLFHLLQRFFRQPDEGAMTPVYLASSPEVEDVTGKYFKRCKPLGTSEESYNRDVQRRLWEASESLTGHKSTI